MANIHSFESFGTVDGPGVRFVVFMQGCPLRCKYCHNPDTWDFKGGKEYTAQEVFEQMMKYINYIKDGGITLSGGEPLAQIDFVIELFTLVKQAGIHTCVDTSGIYFDATNTEVLKKYQKLLSVCDLFLLDIKHSNEEKHRELTGKSSLRIREFARFLDASHKPVWIRHVLVDGYTNNVEDLESLHSFIKTLHNVERIEVLPYHRLGINKYKQLGIHYELEKIKEPTKEEIEKANAILGVDKYVKQ